jgi:preprotein translocase subunit SecE
MYRLRPPRFAVFRRLAPEQRDAYIPRKPHAERVMTNPFQFLQQTRAEVAKVVWPTRREVLVTTAMVFLMAVVFAIFFFGVDWVIRQALELILTIFGGS